MKKKPSILKAANMSLALILLVPFLAYATTPGTMEAINSASCERRNIVGIEISTATDPKDPATGIPNTCKKEGVLISAVIPKHPAAMAGLKVGDVITTINNIRIKTISQALEVIDGLEAGRNYPFEVCRFENNTAQTLTLTVLIEQIQEKAIGKIS